MQKLLLIHVETFEPFAGMLSFADLKNKTSSTSRHLSRVPCVGLQISQNNGKGGVARRMCIRTTRQSAWISLLGFGPSTRGQLACIRAWACRWASNLAARPASCSLTRAFMLELLDEFHSSCKALCRLRLAHSALRLKQLPTKSNRLRLTTRPLY